MTAPVPQVDGNRWHPISHDITILVVLLDLVVVVEVQQYLDDIRREFVDIQNSIQSVVPATPCTKILLDISRHERFELGRDQAEPLFHSPLPVGAVGRRVFDDHVKVV